MIYLIETNSNELDEQPHPVCYVTSNDKAIKTIPVLRRRYQLAKLIIEQYRQACRDYLFLNPPRVIELENIRQFKPNTPERTAAMAANKKEKQLYAKSVRRHHIAAHEHAMELFRLQDEILEFVDITDTGCAIQPGQDPMYQNTINVQLKRQFQFLDESIPFTFRNLHEFKT